ncbi:hypothetical protein C7M84_003830 [Penaeus vannamei]|uniref:Chitin-binding type-2 domain-containing protein n=1 Tax=Penaeus vannamei TaxID=6689 RepID=A0A423TM15_PENVA|nr:hypothetical protein C7M84_003830 [Penaeus vannamei]
MPRFSLMLALALVGAVHADKMFSPPAPPAPGYSYGAPDLRADASTLDQQEQDPIAALAANIPGGGVPGEDYPILASVPDTGFSCEEQQFPGYYADTAPEAGCQVFHICQFDGRQDAFLCPNGTLFNQQYFVCDWWFNVDCAASAQFRSLNADIGKIPEDAAASVRTTSWHPTSCMALPRRARHLRHHHQLLHSFMESQQVLGELAAYPRSSPCSLLGSSGSALVLREKGSQRHYKDTPAPPWAQCHPGPPFLSARRNAAARDVCAPAGLGSSGSRPRRQDVQPARSSCSRILVRRPRPQGRRLHSRPAGTGPHRRPGSQHPRRRRPWRGTPSWPPSRHGFSCEEQQFPGYYADTAPEAGCQVFHICQFDGRQDAFLCPNGTLFNQQYFVCDWWFNVDCAASEQFRSLNADIGKIPKTPLPPSVATSWHPTSCMAPRGAPGTSSNSFSVLWKEVPTGSKL